MLHAAEVLETSRHAGRFGVKVAAGELDIEGLHKYKDKVVTKMFKGLEALIKHQKIEVVRGSGTMTSRYFGLSTDLLGTYAWYSANSREPTP